MSRLFNRIVKVKAQQQAQPAKGSFAATNPQFFEVIEAGLEISQNMIEFDISKNLSSEPNKTVLKIHNLSPDERAFFDRKPTRVSVELGYDGNSRLVTAGDLILASTKRDGTENITTITIGDGIRAYSFARMNKLYPKTTTTLRVLQEAAKSMNTQLPSALLQDPLLKQTLAVSMTVHGFTRDILSTVLATYGYGWSFQNEQLQILKDEDTHAGERILVSDGFDPKYPNTGLLNSPETTAPEVPSSGGKGKPSEIKFAMNAYPEMNPGREIQLQSELLNATAKVIDVKHNGDNKKGKFETAVTARAL